MNAAVDLACTESGAAMRKNVGSVPFVRLSLVADAATYPSPAFLKIGPQPASAPAASANPSRFLMPSSLLKDTIVTRTTREINGNRLESARAFGTGRDRRGRGDGPVGRVAPGRAGRGSGARVRARGRRCGRVGRPAGRRAAAVGDGAELPDGAR